VRTKTQETTTHTASPATQAAARALVESTSLAEAIRTSGVGRGPFHRILAGLPIREGTKLLAETRLGVPSESAKP